VTALVFLAAMDGTVVATLLTPIGSDFNRSHQATYVATSYLLAMCCFNPIYGRLSDILGRKAAILLAMFLFSELHPLLSTFSVSNQFTFLAATGTAICGTAPSMNILIAGRAIAGMGGGG
jgi:MFS family permease